MSIDVGWVLRKPVIGESLFKILQLMCRNARSRVRVNGSSEAVAQRCSIRKVFLNISQNSQESTSARLFFLKKSLWCRCFLVNFAIF